MAKNTNQANKQANRQSARNNQRNNQSRPQQSRQQSNVKKQSNNQQRGQQKNIQAHSQQAVRQQPPRATVQQRTVPVTQQPVRSPQARPEIQNSQIPTQRLNISSNRDAILGRTNQDTSVKNLYAYGNTTRCKPKVNEDAYYVGTIEHFVVMIVADGNGTKEGMVNSGNMAVTLMIDYLNTAINKNTRIE